MVVYHTRGYSPSPPLADYENTYKNVPTDFERSFLNENEPPNIAMQEAERGVDPNGLRADSQQRS